MLLGFIRSKEDLRSLKKQLIRSNTRGVYKADTDDLLVVGNKEIQRIAEAIEKRRIELKKDSGFEKLYARVTKLYFGGMTRHLSELRRVLRPGAQLAYVVGDQASYLRIMIRTCQILADIATSLGYEVVGIDLFLNSVVHGDTRNNCARKSFYFGGPAIKTTIIKLNPRIAIQPSSSTSSDPNTKLA